MDIVKDFYHECFWYLLEHILSKLLLKEYEIASR